MVIPFSYIQCHKILQFLAAGGTELLPTVCFLEEEKKTQRILEKEDSYRAVEKKYILCYMSTSFEAVMVSIQWLGKMLGVTMDMLFKPNDAKEVHLFASSIVFNNKLKSETLHISNYLLLISSFYSRDYMGLQMFCRSPYS